MSLDSLLIHSCVIERDPTNGEDLFGNAPKDLTPELIYSGKCRLVEKQDSVLTERGDRTVVTIYKLILPAMAAVLERDRVVSVTIEDGNVVKDAYTIKSVAIRRGRNRSHLSVDLERIS